MENYNPYKATVEGIIAMFDNYDPNTTDKHDFIDNIRVKCRDAKEYDKLHPSEEADKIQKIKGLLALMIESHGCLGRPEQHIYKNVFSMVEKVDEGKMGDVSIGDTVFATSKPDDK